MILILIIGVFACWILAAICNAVMDTLAHHYDESVFKNMKKQNWWDPRISWANKYTAVVSHRKPKFFGSTTFLVWTTDAWHFFQMMCNSLIILSFILLINGMANIIWWQDFALFIIFKISWGVFFEVFYNKIFMYGRNR